MADPQNAQTNLSHLARFELCFTLICKASEVMLYVYINYKISFQTLPYLATFDME